MLIRFDSQIFLRQKSGGVSRLFSDLINFFDTHAELGIQTEVDFRTTHNEYAFKMLEPHGVRLADKRIPRHVLYAKQLFQRTISAEGVNLIHHTYYDKRFLSPSTDGRRVVTIYDMIPELFRGQIPRKVSHLDKRDFVKSADSIICISVSTKNDLIQNYGGIQVPITVIPLAVDSRFRPGIHKMIATPSDYLLYVGARENYKDFDVLLKALSVIRNQGNEIPLVAVGRKPTRIEISMIRKLGLEGLVLFPSVSDSALPSLYSNARALVQSSRYEGFGLTPLEAMASGIPAIAANSSSMPEVGGDIVQYFEPGNAEDLAQQISRVLGDIELQHTLSSLGPSRAAMFSLERMATATADVYRELP